MTEKLVTKVTASMFLDITGIIFINNLERNWTVTIAYYDEGFRKIENQIGKKIHGKLHL